MPLFGLVPWVAIFFDSAVKGVLILAAAGAFVAAARRAPASLRHLAWTLAVAGLCVTPVLSVIGPRWSAPLLPPSAPDASVSPPVSTVPGLFQAAADPERVPWERGESPAATAARPWASGLLFLWAGGALLVLLRLVVSLVAARCKGSKAAPITDGACTALVAEIVQRYGIRRDVSLRVTEEGTMPATWGHTRPMVVLPVEALDWPHDRLRAVLSHELAHVARGDFLVQTVARFACALHWFNPLAWLAERRLRVECEQASDDLAPGAGLTPSDYAMHLVEVLKAVRPGVEAPLSALAMGRPGRLENRLRAILDTERPRGGLSPRRVAGMVLAATCFLLPLTFVRLEARAQDAPRLERLPQGVTIEVVAVSTHPSGPKTWWGPDGTPLPEAPCDPVARVDEFRGPLVREVVVRVAGLPENVSLNWHPSDCRSYGMGAPQKDGGDVPDLRRVVAEFTDGLTTGVVHFDLPLGPWVTEQVAEYTAGIEKGDRAYFFGKPRPIRQGTAIAVAHNIADRDVRVVAVGRDGREHPAYSVSSGGGKRLRMLDAEFDVPPDQVREYRLQSRPLGRFEIKNVALQPGKGRS